MAGRKLDGPLLRRRAVLLFLNVYDKSARATGGTRPPIEAHPASIGVLSTGEACAVALLLGRLDLLNDCKCPLDALERIGPE